MLLILPLAEAAAGSGASNTTINALIAAGGVIVGAAITALASAYSARKKIGEAQELYAQKLNDTYLRNARLYLQEVYLPLQQAIGQIANEYEKARPHIDQETEKVSEPNGSEFRDGIASYLKVVKALADKAAGAFLTSAIEEELESFNAFLRESLVADKTIRHVAYNARVLWTRYAIERRVTSATRTSYARSRAISSALVGFTSPLAMGSIASISLRQDRVLAAPLGSAAFEERFVDATVRLRAYIKDVTLGQRTNGV